MIRNTVLGACSSSGLEQLPMHQGTVFKSPFLTIVCIKNNKNTVQERDG